MNIIGGVCQAYFWLVVFGIQCISATSDVKEGDYNPASNCYARAVYEELIKVIDTVQMLTVKEKDAAGKQNKSTISLKKFQEDEDDGLGSLGTDLEIPSIVPMIFKVVGSVFSLNSSGVVENSFGIIPERVSSQLTSVLSSLASSILGTSILPTTTRSPPPKRRRRTTTTMAPETTTTTPTTSTSPGPSTTEMLFKESALGELPVYASAYAPNYIATTPYPVYANNFLHVLYAAPTTTTTPATTTSTSTPSTTTDPNSYAVALPFDYHELTTPFINSSEWTGFVNGTISPIDYEEYEYEEGTEESKKTPRSDVEPTVLPVDSFESSSTPATAEDEVENVDSPNTNRSRRISSHIM